MMIIYETTQGDTWDQIAAGQYGNQMAIAPLLDANPRYQDVVVFSSGIRLRVPPLPTNYNNSDILPPWRDDA